MDAQLNGSELTGANCTNNVQINLDSH